MGEFKVHIPVWENGKDDKSYHGMIFVSKWSLSMIPVADKHMAFNNSTMGATSGAVSAYLSGGIHFTPDCYGDGSVHVDLFFLCSVCSTFVCLFAQLHFLIVLSVL